MNIIKNIIICLSIYLAILAVLLFGLYFIADFIKPLQKLYCKIGWHCHMKDYKATDDGEFECKWCGYKGLVDSQGNLF